MVKKIDDINKLLLIKTGLNNLNPYAEKNKPLHMAKSTAKLPQNWARTSGILQYMGTLKNTDLKAKATKKIRLMRGVIIDAVKETHDTWTLDIFVGENDKDYVAGQFISISPHQFLELGDLIKYFEHIKGKRELVRAYSLTSAPGERYISITIKPEGYEPQPGALPPLLSPFLASDLLVGREIEFTGYAGAYVMPEDLLASTDHVIHLVAGSGAVPSFSIIKDELIYKKSPIKHTLIFVNKSFQDIIFHEQIKALMSRFPAQFKAEHYLTKESIATNLGANYYGGRPTFEHISKLIGDPSRTILFACGPAITKWQKKQAALTQTELKPRFMEWVQDVVNGLGIDRKRYKREIYG